MIKSYRNRAEAIVSRVDKRMQTKNIIIGSLLGTIMVLGMFFWLTIHNLESELCITRVSRDMWQSRFDVNAKYRLDHHESCYNYFTIGGDYEN